MGGMPGGGIPGGGMPGLRMGRGDREGQVCNNRTCTAVTMQHFGERSACSRSAVCTTGCTLALSRLSAA